MAQAANTLIQGLNKAGVQTAMKEFSKSMSSMEKTTKLGGFTEFNQGLETLGKLVTVFPTAAIPMNVLMSKFTAAALPGNINLMNSMLESMESEGFSKAIDGFGTMMGTFSSVVGAVIEQLTDIPFVQNVLSGIGDFFLTSAKGWQLLFDKITGVNTEIERHIELLTEEESIIQLRNQVEKDRAAGLLDIDFSQVQPSFG